MWRWRWWDSPDPAPEAKRPPSDLERAFYRICREEALTVARTHNIGGLGYQRMVGFDHADNWVLELVKGANGIFRVRLERGEDTE